MTRSRPLSCKTAYQSFDYGNAPDPEDLDLKPPQTAHLCVDVHNHGKQPAAHPTERHPLPAERVGA